MLLRMTCEFSEFSAVLVNSSTSITPSREKTSISSCAANICTQNLSVALASQTVKDVTLRQWALKASAMAASFLTRDVSPKISVSIYAPPPPSINS